MYKALTLSLLLICALSTHTTLVSSDPLTTTISSPSGKEVAVQAYHTKHHPDYLGDGSKWIWLKPEKYYWPQGCSAVF